MRQKPIGNCIVDFFCSKLKLVIEVDGASHNEKVQYDQVRQRDLEALGLSFLRFDDLEVKQNLEGVVQAIENWIDEFERCGQRQRNNPLAPFIKGEFAIGA